MARACSCLVRAHSGGRALSHLPAYYIYCEGAYHNAKLCAQGHAPL